MMQSAEGERVIYGIDDRPPVTEAVPLGVQHLLAMLLGNITPPLLVAGALGLATGQTAFLVQMALLVAGAATIVQSYPIGRVGGRLPIVMGTSIAFVGGIIAVARQHSLATVFGACLVAGVVEVVLGLSITRIRRFFPPLVNGTVVMLIGLTLIPVGIDYSAGGIGAADYGSPANLGIAALVFVVTLLLNRLARGFWSAASLLIGVSVGFAVAFAAGRVDTSGIGSAAWIEIPRPLVLGLDFDLTAIFVMAAIYVVSAMETLGDIAGTVAAAGREPTNRELSGGLVADGVMSSIAALFGAFPNTSYSQNVGLVNFTGVVSRHVTAITGGLMIALGLVPKVGALLATIPAAVIGGGAVIMFSMIFASGALIIHRGVELDQRNLVIMAVAVGLGLGVELRPEALAALPQGLRSFFGSGLITGGLTALVLNVALPGRHRD
jgi:NCS2 family nucleobase:cation symporter-2